MVILFRVHTSETPSDPVLARLAAAPVRLILPAEQRLPFIFAVPHSGRLYPESFIAGSALSARMLRRSEDAYVDELYETVTALGSPLVAAEFPRAYVDANRSPRELDPTMFDAPLEVAYEADSTRVAAGLGVIARVVRDGVEIYRDKLDAREADARLTAFYRPYHSALATLVEDTWARFGCAVVIDCHSMPSIPSVAEIVLGDCHGASVCTALTRHVEQAFCNAGFATARNAPYAGGFTTHLYARRDVGVHALQIEINRALYLDEDRVEKTPAFAAVKGRLGAVLRQLANFDISRLKPRGKLAAE